MKVLSIYKNIHVFKIRRLPPKDRKVKTPYEGMQKEKEKKKKKKANRTKQWRRLCRSSSD